MSCIVYLKEKIEKKLGHFTSFNFGVKTDTIQHAFNEMKLH